MPSSRSRGLGAKPSGKSQAHETTRFNRSTAAEGRIRESHRQVQRRNGCCSNARRAMTASLCGDSRPAGCINYVKSGNGAYLDH
jgi:hypothetical protein